MIILAGCQ